MMHESVTFRLDDQARLDMATVAAALTTTRPDDAPTWKPAATTTKTVRAALRLAAEAIREGTARISTAR